MQLIHDVILVPASSDPLHLKNVEKKGENGIFWEWKETFRWNEKHYSLFYKCFLLVKYKFWGYTEGFLGF